MDEFGRGVKRQALFTDDEDWQSRLHDVTRMREPLERMSEVTGQSRGHHQLGQPREEYVQHGQPWGGQSLTM